MLSKSQVKYIQSLNEKKFRKELGVFVAEGPKIINELLANPAMEPVVIYGVAEWWLQHAALKEKLPVDMIFELNESELERISFLSTPNQVLGIFKQPDTGRTSSFKHRITILLDGIQDPGNLGTIIRIADWFGIQQVIASKDSADVYNPKVVQSTMGSIARVHLLYEDLGPFISANAEIPVFASTLLGKPLSSVGKVQEGMLLIGNESKGISHQLLQLSTIQVTIPAFGHAESLNAAVALGIILSHIV